MQGNTISVRDSSAVLTTNKLIRNTYILLSMTLLFSALTATLAIFLRLPPMTNLIATGGALVLMWFVLPRTANSTKGIGVVFATTGLLGLGLGPLLSMYLSMPNGPQVVATALGGTGVIFLGLSGYALTTKKDFSFLGGFLFTGFIIVLLASLLNIFLGIPALGLTVSAAVIMIMSGFLLYQTSAMIHGGETNYILATIGLYVTILNLFTSLLHILGFVSNE